MAIHHGNEGEVQVNSNTVANVKSFTLEETIDDVDASTMGSTNRLYKTGLKDWTASLECMWDETDTNGQEAMTVGTTVTLNLYPEGSTTGDTFASMSGTIMSVGIATSADDIVTRSVSVKPANASGVTWDVVV